MAEHAKDVDQRPAAADAPDDDPVGALEVRLPDDASEAEAIQHDISALLHERDQFKDIAMRLQADFENYRKRQAAVQAD